MKFLLSITTTNGSNWREKIREATSMRIEEVALFPTVLNSEERKSLYALIADSSIKRIPFVHLRSDMGIKELDFFIEKYDTRIFNTHSEKQFPINREWINKYREFICIENTHDCPLDGNEIKKYGGICLDLSHLENSRLTDMERYNKEVEVLNKFPVKCNHISAIKKDISFVNSKKRELEYDSHHLDDLTELDYLRKYPLKYFSNFCAIELENNFSEQMEAMQYINKFMESRDKLISKMVEN